MRHDYNGEKAWPLDRVDQQRGSIEGENQVKSGQTGVGNRIMKLNGGDYFIEAIRR